MRRGEETTWWSRNWGWVVGIGCGCLLLPVLLVGACVGGLGYLVSSRVDTDTVFAHATEMVEAHPEVRARLGTPIEIGWFGANTTITVDGDGGEAEYDRPISGPDGAGTMHVEAVRVDGEWRIERLVVRIDGETIDVLGGEAPPEPEPEPEPDSESEADDDVVVRGAPAMPSA